MSTNLDLWKAVERTDPKQTKAITGKPYKGTSPKPYYLVQKATETFGPCGIGWGFQIVSERVEDGSAGDKVHIAHVRLWYVWQDKRGEVDQQRKWREISQLKASQIAAMAASGIDTSFGSAADVIGDTAVLGTEDVSIIAENAARETRGFQIQAQNYTNEGKAQKRAGTQALITAGFNVTSTILGGANQLQGMKLPGPSGSAAGGPGPAAFGGSAWGAPYIRTK